MKQWYTVNPSLLQQEKALMAQHFPQFSLEKSENGNLYWLGELSIDNKQIIEKPKKYTVCAVYANIYPQARMDYPIRVYPVIPDVGEMQEKYGRASLNFRPDENPYGYGSQILMDSASNFYVATLKEDKMNNYSAVKELRFFECWLQLCLCVGAMRLEAPAMQISWKSLTARYKHLENYISKRIYGKI